MTAAESTAAREAQSREEAPAARATAGNAQRVSSVAPAPELPSDGAPLPATERDILARLRQVQTRAQVAAAAVLSGASLLHARPPSLAEIHERHRHSARHFEAGLVRWPRHAWGGFHTSLAALLYGLLWAISSPAGLVVLAGSVIILWFWL